MKISKIFGVLVLLLSLAMPWAANANLNRAQRLTVTVKCGKGWGSGFIISPDEVVTNCHVLMDGTEAAAILYDPNISHENEQYSQYWIRAIRKVKRDYANDLAILKFPNAPFTDYLSLASGDPPVSLGEDVCVIGTPNADMHRQGTVTCARISNLHISGSYDVPGFQMNGLIQGGTSGGPVVNNACLVVGIAFSGVLAAVNIYEWNKQSARDELTKMFALHDIPYTNIIPIERLRALWTNSGNYEDLPLSKKKLGPSSRSARAGMLYRRGYKKAAISEYNSLIAAGRYWCCYRVPRKSDSREK